MNPFTQIEKWISEHGSASILRDHIAYLKEQMVNLEREVARLQDKVKSLEAEKEHLKKQLEDCKLEKEKLLKPSLGPIFVPRRDPSRRSVFP